jgi:hypothetical protein
VYSFLSPDVGAEFSENEDESIEAKYSDLRVRISE